MDADKYKRVVNHWSKKRTLLNTPIKYLTGQEEIPDVILDELCQSGYACAHKERHRRNKLKKK